MLNQTNANTDNGQDEELHDILIAISVIAKRLAKKLSGMDADSQTEGVKQ